MTQHEVSRVNPREARTYAAEIAYVADYYLKNLRPINVRTTNPEEANKLSLAIDHINQHHLMPAVDSLVDDLKKEKPIHQKPQSVQYPPLDTLMRQANFFKLVPQKPVRYEILSQDGGQREDPLERTIDRWHQTFQKRGLQAERARNRILGSEAAREWRSFLKKIGYSAGQRRERLSQKTEIAIQRLADAGVLEKLYHHMTNEEQLKMIEILKEFDREQRKIWRDWDASP